MHLHPPSHFNIFTPHPSFEWTTCDLKIVIDFFLGGEVISLRLNLSLGVGDYVCIFNLWNQGTSKGKDVVECVGLLSFNNWSLVTCSSETYYSLTTCHFLLVDDTCSFKVIILGKNTLDNGNHFLTEYIG
jgi:hypothetical protein